MAKCGPNTDKLRKIRLPGGATTTVIGELAPSTRHLGKGKTVEDGKTNKGFSAPMAAPGNPRSGGPTTVLSSTGIDNPKTKGGH